MKSSILPVGFLLLYSMMTTMMMVSGFHPPGSKAIHKKHQQQVPSGISSSLIVRGGTTSPSDSPSTAPNKTAPNNLKPLTIQTIEEAIDKALSLPDDNNKELPQTLLKERGIRLERIQDWESTLLDAYDGSFDDVYLSEFLQMKTPWYFGIKILQEEEEKHTGIFTFYVAYSSWNGRILYVDRLDCDDDDDDEESTTEELLLRILAQIAIDLDCARITWRHKSTPKWHLEGNNRPENHKEVLTLSMDEKAMSRYISDSPISSAVVPLEGEFNKNLVESALSNFLEKLVESTGSPFRLRLVKTMEDLDTMTGLVQGLADYCEESDAVHMKADDYVQDGLDLKDNPLWYCLLVDKQLDDDGTTITCGYAFVFVGYILGEGRFLYLEDLFLQVEHRGGGGGSMVMKALVGLCQATHCKRLVWQALDWNTDGLKFYDKIGAKIHLGEQTSRYATNALQLFAKEGRRTGRIE